MSATLHPRPAPALPLRVLSLGGGVQSTAMLLMALAGEFEAKPDLAIFADTGAEPSAVYEHLDWLEAEVAPFPVHRVASGNIREDVIQNVQGGLKRFASIPFHLENKDGSKGMLRRQCTSDYKVTPIRRHLRTVVGPKGQVELWIGISLDEHWRMKESGRKWIVNRWPLIEARMSRRDCLNWLEAHGYAKPPKSACTFCPFHNDSMWRDMKQNDPVSFQDAVEFERACKNLPRIKGEVFLHSSLKPLDEVYFGDSQMDLFADGCEEGYCGV